MPKSGEVVLAQVQFTDTFEVKARPAVVLFEEFGNVVIAGVTSNKKMSGVPLTKEEGAIKDSVIKLNYIFTISENMIKKELFELTESKKKMIFDKLNEKIEGLNP